jgi:hypothetical protein
MDPSVCLPGRWYVSFPNLDAPDLLPTVGPFDTEREARDWLELVNKAQSGFIWHCFVGPDGRRAARNVVLQTPAEFLIGHAGS